MKIYWTLKSIPELAHLPRKERGRRWRQVSRKAFRHWQTWAGFLCCGLCAGLGSAVSSAFWPYYEASLRPVIFAAIGGGIGGFISSQIMINIVRRHYLSEEKTLNTFD